MPAEWNETAISYGAPSNLRDLLAAQVERSPDAVAVSCDGAALSYRELDSLSSRLARRLARSGVGPDVLVAIVAERSLEMVVSLVAVVKAGAAYVPVDPGYPADRVAFMIRDSDAPVLLTQGHLVDRLPDVEAEVILVDGPPETPPSWHGEDPLPPEVEVSADHLAYVIYTSGSTGRPKGAMNAHGAIANRLLWMQQQYELNAWDRVLQKTPFSFDVSVWEFFWPLIVGARIVVARPDGHKDASYLASTIAEQGVTVCHFVPSMLRAFLTEPHLRDRCRSLRHVICSGEALTKGLQDELFAISDTLQLHNLYGPTEAAIDVTHWTCRRSWAEDSIPIGRPVANTRIYVLDEGGQPLPVGEIGELYIAGAQVGTGYYGRPDLTRERFLADPFVPGPGARMYRSGDLARWRPDGNLEFRGRVDHQVKILGMRIELGEIESALESHAGVRQAAVLAREDVPGQKQLVAYVVGTDGGTPPSVPELRRHLRERLPDYMVPPLYVPLREMPLTSSGKTDRKALPSPSRRRPELDQAYVAPLDPIERFICEVWSGLLRIDAVGTHDRFFDLGGDSLLAAEFVRAMEKELGENIYIVSIFDAPTVAEYASFLKQDYGAAVERRFGPAGPRAATAGAAAPLADDDVAAFLRLVPTLEGTPPDERNPRNPPAIFILAPPRSGTTLLRVMMAGHPGLFAAAELQLLGFHTLRRRREAFTGKFALWLEGAIRAVMELRGCDADEARSLIEARERSNVTTKAFYRELQGWIGDRMLVDKSPSYALNAGALRKAERDFEAPRYVQLVRHPYAMIRSFERYHMEQVLYLAPHAFTARRLAELVWTVSHETVNDFLTDVPDGRKTVIRYEDLVVRPESVVRRLCSEIGIDFHPNLLDPYKDIEAKMVDGIHDVSAPMGDTHLLQKRSVDAAKADDWKGVLTDDFLGERTWALAEGFGYERPSRSRGPGDANRDAEQRRRSREAGLRRARALRARHRGEDGGP